MPNRLKALLGGLVSLALMLPGADLAAAETYTVTRNDDPNPAPCEPSDCSLRGALMAANSTTTVDDVVVVPASASPYLLQYEFLTFQINDETEVRGAGANQTVVKGDGLETIFGIGAGVKATMTGLTITGGNSAIQSNGELLVRGVAIEGNKWNGGTAGIITNGPLTVEDSFLGFNRTEAASGGVIHSNAPLTIVNSTLAHNTSKDGPGAISVNFGVPVTITNSAVVSNRSETSPAAAVGGAPLILRNNVFADNRDTVGLSNCVSLEPVVSLGGNVSDDASCGTEANDKPNVNPGLGTLALHGGTTQVYELLAGSPAIDAATQCPAADQRGVARPQGGPCDSGPFEQARRLSTLLPGRFLMRLGRKNLKLSRKGFVRVRLACVETEEDRSCHGRVKLKGRRFVFGSGTTLVARPPRARFTIAAGKVVGVRVRVPRSVVTHLRSTHKPLKVLVEVSASDGAGQVMAIKGYRKVVLAGNRR